MYCHGLRWWRRFGWQNWKVKRQILLGESNLGLVHSDLSRNETCAWPQDFAQRHQVPKCVHDKVGYHQAWRLRHRKSLKAHSRCHEINGRHSLLLIARDHRRKTILLQEWYLVFRGHALRNVRAQTPIWGDEHAFLGDAYCEGKISVHSFTLLKGAEGAC